jgi:hypothetical protein
LVEQFRKFERTLCGHNAPADRRNSASPKVSRSCASKQRIEGCVTPRRIAARLTFRSSIPPT